MPCVHVVGAVCAIAFAPTCVSAPWTDRGAFAAESLSSGPPLDQLADLHEIPNYSWSFLRLLISSLDSLLYPEENSQSHANAEEPIVPQPISPLQIKTEGDISKFLSHFSLNGTPTDLSDAEWDETDTLTTEIQEILDEESGIIAVALEDDLREAVEDIRTTLRNGVKNANPF